MNKNQELITNAIAKMSNEEKALIFPPIERKNFVVRKNWLGRNHLPKYLISKSYPEKILIYRLLYKLHDDEQSQRCNF